MYVLILYCNSPWILEVNSVAVFKYKAILKNREDYVETGTVIAKTELDAKEKLRKLDYDGIRVKKLGGFSGIFKKFTADVR